MKAFFGILVLTLLASVAYAQSTGSPLAPPKLPPPGGSGASSKLKLGEKAPDFALPNGDGKLVTLSEYTQRTPTVLVFYRGFW
jgi:hypothetical protein